MKRSMVCLVAAVSVAFLAVGCGKQEAEVSAGEPTPAAQAGAQGQVMVPAAGVPSHGLAETTPQETGPSAAEADSLPPDLVAIASAKTVRPGEVVEITAQGSTDVVEMILFDGIKRTALAYDEETKVWRSVYRVPMRTTADRVGLSVTAKNGQGRWQRIWVFLEVQREGEQAAIQEGDGC